jgi:hypothetical protein
MTVACLNVSIAGMAPQSTLRAALHVRLIWGDIEYGDQRIKGQGVILRGEPLMFDIGIMNRYEGPPAFAEGDWFQRIVATLSPGGRFDNDGGAAIPFTCTPQSIRSVDFQIMDDHVVLGPNGSQFIRCKGDPLALHLVAGQYTVMVAWSDAANMQRFQEHGRALTTKFEFEVREVLTRDDEVDLLNHLTSHALLDGRLNEALQFAERVLRQRPSSITALRARADVRSAQGACGEAVEDLQNAAKVIEVGLDTGNQPNTRLGGDQRRAAAQHLLDQARALKCP